MKTTSCDTGPNNTRKNPGFVCAYGGSGTGTCYADSGSPLVFQGKLVGLVSRGLGGCSTGKPDGFANISFYYSWIQKNIKADN